ncbi:MAG: DUF167 domain-containing protein [Chitinispirillaceae bacterium]|nr:DUF167 domain-containing protein [Chitinispirillaceae bacterium]
MGTARLEIRLKPRAKSDRIRVGPAGLLDIAVTSPPVDGRANEHLVRLLSDRLGVAKSSIKILRGGHSRNKAVMVEGFTKEEALGRFLT